MIVQPFFNCKENHLKHFILLFSNFSVVTFFVNKLLTTGDYLLFILTKNKLKIMSISDLYSSGKHKQEIGHFASIVKIAKVDTIITEGEEKLLNKAAKKLNISETEYAEILKNPEKFPVNPPVSYDERIERLYRLTKMIFADAQVDKEEVGIMRKIAVALQFPTDNVEKVCDEAVHLILNDNDLEDFTNAIKKVNLV
ncbi:hypothetical protein T190115A13A_50107 [Tenacibaculum sp. 190524A02b]|uniref:TerB family tellurite resistance protein n=2 Tax=Tenacibaculum vairaonense TaxID=3137860 RepID=A0ABP1FBX6_9FLAO